MRREGIAHNLVDLARKTLKVVSHYSMGGIVDVDFVESGGAFTLMCAILAPYYKMGTDEQRAIIAVFIKQHDKLKDMPVDDAYFLAVETLYDDLNSMIGKLDRTLNY